MRWLALIVTWAIAPAVWAQAPQPRDVDNFELKRGTAVVRGRVTDAETGAPMPGVTLSLSLLGTRGQVDTKSDANGAFEFSRVPAGRYVLLADPIGRTRHRAWSYGAVEGKPAGKHSIIVLQNGQVFDQAHIALPRSFVISARVVDEDGEPVADVQVRGQGLHGAPSERSRTTDDLGTVRLWGYAPGTYRVCAIPYNGADRPAAEGFIRTCYPSATSNSEAQPVTITNADPPEVEIRLRRSRLFRVNGFVLDASGALAANAHVSLVTPIEDNNSYSSRSVRTEGGSFTVRGLPPGEYVVKAEIGNAYNPEDATRQSGFTHVNIQSSDVENLAILMTPPASVRGRLVFEGGPPPSLSGVTVRADAVRGTVSMLSGRSDHPSPVNDDLTFELRGLFGPYTVHVNGLHGWIVKSVRYRGEERINIPTDFKSPDGAAIEIVLTNRPARLIARVLDDKGQPVEGARVLLFPADPRQWDAGRDGSVSRWGVRREGQYEFGELRSAEYFVAVVPDGMALLYGDRRQLEELSKRAERITVLENDQRSIDLMVSK